MQGEHLGFCLTKSVLVDTKSKILFLTSTTAANVEDAE